MGSAGWMHDHHGLRGLWDPRKVTENKLSFLFLGAEGLFIKESCVRFVCLPEEKEIFKKSLTTYFGL